VAQRFDMRVWMSAAAAVAIVITSLISCTATQTSTSVTPSPTQKCQFRLSTSSSSFSDSGGTGTLTIDTTRDCAWSVSSNAEWVSVATPSGQGGASVSYTVSASAVPQARVANLTVEGQTVQLSEQAAPCRFSLSSNTGSIANSGGSLAVTVQTLTGCGWSTSSDSGWLVVANPSGNSTAVVGVRIAANNGPQRVGHAVIGGQPYTVVQDAAATSPVPAPVPSPTPTPTPMPTPPPPIVPSVTTISGAVSSLSGECPDLILTVNGTTVVTSQSTKFTGGNCKHLESGTGISATGTVLGNGSIEAASVRIGG
jgi:hypothetical protein